MKAYAYCCLLFSVVTTGCSTSTLDSAPDCFQAVFHRPLPATAHNLRAEGHYYDDTQAVWLRFSISQPALLGIIQTHPQYISRQWFISAAIAPASPAWWKPLSGKPKIFIRSTKLHDNEIDGGTGYIAYDPASQVAYVYSFGAE
jgi:hypothetical protein